MFTQLPPFKCSAVNSSLNVIANSSKSICIMVPDQYTMPENTRTNEYRLEHFGFAYRGKKYFINNFHLVIENDEVFFRTTENGRVFEVKSGNMDGYAIHRFIYNSELTQTGKEMIAGKILYEIYAWYKANREEIIKGLNMEAARQNLERIKRIEEKIEELNKQREELIKERNNLKGFGNIG